MTTSVWDLNFRHLGAILAIDRCGSVSAAAVAVNISQPALTQALAKLEAALDHALFDRQPRGAIATPAGRLFLDRAGRAIDQIVEVGAQLRRSAKMAPLPHLERVIAMSQLRALSAVERAGSYALASRSIGLSQPSVHRAANELELILKIPLLVRSGRTMRATPAASRLVRAIRIAISELQAGLDELAALSQAGAGRIAIGTLALPRSWLLPRAIARFARTHPDASVTIAEGTYDELLAHLRGGDIDMLVGALRDPLPVRDVRQQALFADDLWIVGRADHPMAHALHPNRAALARYPWVIGARGAPMRRQWETMFAADTGPRPSLCVESASILMARGLLLEDDWLALMSFDQFRADHDAGVLTPIGPPIPGSRRSIGVTIRADWHPTATQQALMETLHTVAVERNSEN